MPAPAPAQAQSAPTYQPPTAQPAAQPVSPAFQPTGAPPAPVYQPPTADHPTIPAPVPDERTARSAPVRASFEDVPSPIPARPIVDPGPFTASAAPVTEPARPTTPEPFAGSFQPAGTTPSPSTPPVPTSFTPAEPYRMPDTEGTSRGRQASEEPFSVPENTLPEAKSFVATWLLAWLLGTLGIDRFYLGKTVTGIVKLVTAGGLGVWALYDLFLTLLGHQTAKDGSPLAGYDEHKKLAWIVTLGVWLVLVAAYVAVLVFGVVDLSTF
jgi:TM2 domain-containing membrane protein YozV